ncbi:MAG: rhomboid family intramembrane serine protease [Fimbriimonadales bacterium]|nr:rhomboid family intramembrane serine protease [Fimbriimonadales bacterium]
MRVAPPAATLLVLGVNTATLLWLNSRVESVEPLGFIPAQPSLWSAFVSLFVHASWLHWLKNALFLGLFGWYVERALGWKRWLILYFASGFGAVGLHWAMSLTIQPALYREGLVGASGAISGLVGYFALRFYRRKGRLLWSSPSRWGLAIPMWVGVVLWVLLQGVGAVLEAGQPAPSEVGYWAHLGGFATGLTLALIWGAGAAGEQEFLIQQAEQALQQGAAGDALRWLQPLLQPPQPEPNALYLQGAAWAMLGDLDEAERALKTALQRALEKSDDALLRPTADLLCEIDRLHTLSLPTLRALFQRLERYHERERALHWLEALTRHPETPERPEWLLLRASLLEQQGQTEAARSVLQQLVNDYPDSLQAAMAKLERRR